MSPGALLLLAATLVLRSGDRLPLDAPAKQANGKVTFRSGGTLYSLPAEEVARIEEDTKSTTGNTKWRTGNPACPDRQDCLSSTQPAVRLKVSDEERKRLIEKLEKNHSGTAPEPIAALPDEPKTSSAAKADAANAYRERERTYEAAIETAKQNLAAAEEQAAALERKIISLIGMGYDPDSFTYDSMQLERARAAIPRARAEIERAEKTFVEFKEAARKSGLRPE